MAPFSFRMCLFIKGRVEWIWKKWLRSLVFFWILDRLFRQNYLHWVVAENVHTMYSLLESLENLRLRGRGGGCRSKTEICKSGLVLWKHDWCDTCQSMFLCLSTSSCLEITSRASIHWSSHKDWALYTCYAAKQNSFMDILWYHIVLT